MAVWTRYLTRSWCRLSCLSSTAITSCFMCMIMHSPLSQESVQNSCKLKTSQLFHGLHTHNMSPIEQVWDALGQHVRQRVPLRTAIEEEWDNIPQATINSLKICQGKWWSHEILTCFVIHTPTFILTYLYSQSCEIHRLGPNECIYIDWFTYMICNSLKSLKLLHVAFIFLLNECSVILQIDTNPGMMLIISPPIYTFQKMNSNGITVKVWPYLLSTGVNWGVLLTVCGNRMGW
jgi:hypothetical protein